MSHSEVCTWLIAYDIANPRRLQRVHTYLKRHAVPLQYSVFVTRLNERALSKVLAELKDRIDDGTDDVRAYRLPQRCKPITLGRQILPLDVILAAEGLNELLNSDSDED